MYAWCWNYDVWIHLKFLKFSRGTSPNKFTTFYLMTIVVNDELDVELLACEPRWKYKITADLILVVQKLDQWTLFVVVVVVVVVVVLSRLPCSSFQCLLLASSEECTEELLCTEPFFYYFLLPTVYYVCILRTHHHRLPAEMFYNIITTSSRS